MAKNQLLSDKFSENNSENFFCESELEILKLINKDINENPDKLTPLSEELCIKILDKLKDIPISDSNDNFSDYE